MRRVKLGELVQTLGVGSNIAEEQLHSVAFTLA